MQPGPCLHPGAAPGGPRSLRSIPGAGGPRGSRQHRPAPAPAAAATKAGGGGGAGGKGEGEERRGRRGSAGLGSARAGRPLPRVPPRSAAPAAVLPERPEAGGGAPALSPGGGAQPVSTAGGRGLRCVAGEGLGAAALAVCEQQTLRGRCREGGGARAVRVPLLAGSAAGGALPRALAGLAGAKPPCRAPGGLPLPSCAASTPRSTAMRSRIGLRTGEDSGRPGCWCGGCSPGVCCRSCWLYQHVSVSYRASLLTWCSGKGRFGVCSPPALLPGSRRRRRFQQSSG